jgi:excisionase family DNA binding protein
MNETKTARDVTHTLPDENRHLDALLRRPTLSVPEAGQVLGIARGSAYEAARRGEIPTIKIGQRLRVPTAKLLAMLSP